MGAVDQIAAPMTLAMPCPGLTCRCLMDAAGPGSWSGSVP